MCGIAGILGNPQKEDLLSTEKMIFALKHRGPDGSLVKKYNNAILGFSRLAIIDFSGNGMQPMESADGRFSIVFNGEIYNYLELKKELLPFFKFHSETDTEVLLNGFIHFGPEILQKINGMFAFCIFDHQKNEAFMARDRFGQKPLFYFLENNRLFFASEVKAFLAAGKKFKPDIETWLKYLNHGICEDNEHSFFKDVIKIKPGHCLYFSASSGEIKIKEYYDITKKIKKVDLSLEEAIPHLENLLKESFEIHTRSDVPYTISLSGGLDSSALLSCLNSINKLYSETRCFTVDFEDDLRESVWADKAANNFNLYTSITSMTTNDMISLFSEDIFYQEYPIGGLMNMAQTINHQTIHRSGFKVVLDGAGVDEIFCGYKPSHQKYLLDLCVDKDERFEPALRDYCQFWEEDYSKALLNILSLVNNKLRTEIDGTFSSSAELLKKEFIIENGHKTNINEMSLLDMQINYIKFFKLNRGLRMKDRASMKNSIELRVPFIDHRLVEFGLSLNPNLYFHLGRTKSIFRELFKEKMEEEVRTTKKRNINAPQGKWLRKENVIKFVNDLIKSESFASRGIFDADKVIKSYESYCENPTENSFFIWQWINFELWHRVFID